MHIFLTGDVQVGKSTSIRAFLAFSDLDTGGFVTVWRKAPDGGDDLHIFPFGQEQNFPDLTTRAAHRLDRECSVYSRVFDTVGSSIIENCGKKQLIIMDELGYMESGALIFQQAVFEKLDGNVPILGVVKPKNTEFLNAVRSHPKVHLLTVTSENRGNIPGEIAKLLI